MQVLSKGFKLPETNDKGSVWFPAIEDNITQLNSHDHDGTDSALIPSSSIDKTNFTSSIVAANWVSAGGGTYTRTVTVPAAISGAATFADILYYNISVKTTSGTVLHPTITRTSASQFVVTVNDNTLDLYIYYT